MTTSADARSAVRARDSAADSQAPRRFLLVRHHDVTGISGDGVVAHGIQWLDRTVVLRWVTYPSTAVWDSINAMLDVHGHVGATTVTWLD